jgi:hypothetical protein
MAFHHQYQDQYGSVMVAIVRDLIVSFYLVTGSVIHNVLTLQEDWKVEISLQSGWSLSCRARQIPIAKKMTLTSFNGISLYQHYDNVVAIVLDVLAF